LIKLNVGGRMIFMRVWYR